MIYGPQNNENGNGYAKGKNKNKNNNGKHNGWYKNGNSTGNPSDPYDLINPEIFEFTGYINDTNQDYTQVLMTTDIDGNYRGVYTYGNGERISVEDLGQVEGVPNNPLYYLSDALGSTVAITNMNAGIIDNNRFAPYGEPLSPVAKNSRLTNSPWGYTGESHDIEAGLIYLRARYYEPGTSRFIQQDSYPYFGEIEKPITRNLYLYTNGNPLNYTDPSGHIALVDDAVVILILATGVVVTVTYAYIRSDEGQRKLREGAVAVHNGLIIAGKAITSAAEIAVDGVINGTKWVGGIIVDGVSWVGDKAGDVWDGVTSWFSNPSKDSEKVSEGEENTEIWEKENRVPQDGETVLGDGTYKPTYKRVKGAKVYEKDGKSYHRDTLHKGKSAHLEVYDKKGKHIGEADPKSGELKPGTKDPNKKLPK